MKKLMNKKGFTLMEMLIVVAIIVILVAISVPTFTANLDESKVAVDDANMRAAKSAAVIYVIDKDITENKTLYYDADNGKIVESAAPTDKKGYGQAGDNKNEYIEITYTAATATTEATYTYAWTEHAD